MADLLEELGHPVHLGPPPAIKVLAQQEAKSDRCDGDRLGKFQLRGILPESYLASPEVRQIRERTRYRMALSRLRSGVKIGKAGRRFLEDLPLPEASRRALCGYLDVLDQIQTRIAEAITCYLKTGNLPELPKKPLQTAKM